ncbi:U3 small nucleolar RNA-associated protein 13 [[Candida] railenensis]|uniref:U3 small nucleolar RNA-associated protein 13 n=1 Tax=[Candida] railenensis TaxID=45579 RepID=A0A9P0QKF1_9ASCO|nr:U3 small nucleolar RNA-associated protein 13 [[Candida] railenensis]
MDLKSSYSSTLFKPFYVGTPAATISLDGDLVCTPMEEDIILTSLVSNDILYKIEGDDELVTTVTLTLDGKYLAVTSQSQQLRIFRINQDNDFESDDDLDFSVTELKTFKLSSPVYISATDSTSSLFAFGGSDGTVTVWDIEGGFVTHSLKGHGTTVCSLSFESQQTDQKQWRLASGDTMGTVKVWDLVKRKCIATINEHTSAVRGVAFSGSSFLTAGRDEIVVIYNEKYKPVKTFSVGQVVECAGFVDKESFYTAGSGNVLQILDCNDGSPINSTTKPLETNEELVIINVQKLEDDCFTLVLSDQTIVKLDESLNVVTRVAGNHGTIADIKYVGPSSENGQLLALATNSPALRLVNLARPLEVELLEGHTDLLNAVDVSACGKWIASAGKDNEARVWHFDEESEKFVEYAVFQGHAGSVTAISLPKLPLEVGQTPTFLITGSSDLTVKKWKIPKIGAGEEAVVVKTSDYTRRAHEKDINSIDISPNDEFFATASYDKLGKVWNLESGETVGVLRGHKRGLWDISFCQYDKLLATSSGDKSIKVWSLQDFTCTKTFEGHTNAVQRVKFMNKNQQLISSGADGLIKIWDIKSNETLKTLDSHDNRIWAFDIKEDGEQFISADADGYMSLWVDNTDEMLALEASKMKEKVEQEQKLSNYINNSDWSNAFLLALTLDHPMRLYNVFKSSIGSNQDPDSKLGSKKLESTISKLSDDQVLTLFKRCRDWNINSKFFEISQKVLQSLLMIFESERLVEVKGLTKIIDGIVAYSERHFNRIDDLVEQSFMLDYAVEEMNKA